MENSKLKSKIGKFYELGTSPYDYKPMISVVYTHVENCELCGSALNFSFLLAHKDDTQEGVRKSLFIGSDCLENLAEVYMPYDKATLKRKIADLIETSKKNTFLKQNPDIKEVASEIKKYINEDLRKYCYEHNLMPQFYSLHRSVFYKNISSDIKAILRKNYLSKPKTKKVYELKKAISENKLEKLLNFNNEMKQKKVSQLVETEKEFYDWLFSKLPPETALERKQKIMDQVAYDLFEQQNKLVENKEKSIKMVIIKNVY